MVEFLSATTEESSVVQKEGHLICQLGISNARTAASLRDKARCMRSQTVTTSGRYAPNSSQAVMSARVVKSLTSQFVISDSAKRIIHFV